MLLFRTTQSAQFVHSGDPEATSPGKPGPASKWLLAEGQPETASRVRVRPLSHAEVREYETSLESSGAEAARQLILKGLVDIDGEPVDVSTLSLGWDVQIANLVWGVTTGPLASGPSSASAPAEAATE